MISQQITIDELKHMVNKYNQCSIICNIIDCFNSVQIMGGQIRLCNSIPDVTTTNNTHSIIDNITCITVVYLKPIKKYNRLIHEYITTGIETQIKVITKTEIYNLILFLNNA